MGSGVELLAAGGFGCAEAATNLVQRTNFAAGAVRFGCAARQSGKSEALAANGQSEALLALRRGGGTARAVPDAATAGVSDTRRRLRWLLGRRSRSDVGSLSGPEPSLIFSLIFSVTSVERRTFVAPSDEYT